MPRLTPTDAADEHRLLTESFTSVNQQAYARSVLESITASSLRDLSTAQRRETAKHQFDVLTSATRVGETAFLSDDMHTFARIAAGEFTDDDYYDFSRLPFDQGVMFYESPYIRKDINNDDFPVDAVVWNRMGNRVFLYWLIANLKHPAQSLANSQAPEDVRRSAYHVVHALVLADGSSIGSFQIPDEVVQQLADARGIALPADHAMESSSALWYAVMLLMDQTLTSVVTYPLPRPALKRARRANLNPHVTVIQLRRTDYHRPAGGYSDTGRHLTTRHVRRGHWRNQPTKDGIKRIYIAHTIVGPEGAPLLVTHKINALVK